MLSFPGHLLGFLTSERDMSGSSLLTNISVLLTFTLASYRFAQYRLHRYRTFSVSDKSWPCLSSTTHVLWDFLLYVNSRTFCAYLRASQALNRYLMRILNRLIIGDLNAEVDETKEDPHLHRLVGKYSISVKNNRGDCVLQFCTKENFTIMTTWFKYHIRIIYSWISPGDLNRNQIDYIMVQTRWRSSVLDVRTHPGADCESDHQLLAETISIRLKKIYKTKS